jgi:hypothetical protein
VNHLTLFRYTRAATLLRAAPTALLIGNNHAQLWRVLLINWLSAVAVAFDNPCPQVYGSVLPNRQVAMGSRGC